ncbi:MAG: two-component system sensor histidine kinase BarA [Paraglaciecola sp.]|jgi:two-component system sensor histidine kinase BarA
MLATLLRTLFVCLILISQFASGKSAVQLISTDEVTRLSSQIKVFQEIQDQLTVDQVRERIAEFHSPLDENPNYGFHSKGVWLYTTISNITDTEKWVLDIGFAQLDKVDIYLFIDGKIVAQTQQGKSRLTQLYRFPTIKATFPYAQTVELFVRLESLKFSLVAPIDIQSDDHYERINFYDNLVWGLFYGGLLILAIYNLMLYAGLRENSLLAYVGYISTVVIWQFVWGGHLNLIVMPSLASWVNLHTELIFVIIGIGSGIFTIYFLEAAKTAPKTFRFIKTNIAILVLLGLCSVFNLLPPLWQNILLYVTSISAIASYTYAGFESYANKFYAARFFIFAWGIFAIAALIGMLTLIGLVPSNFFTSYCFQFGVFLDAGLFSLALMDKSRHQLELEIQQATNDLRNNIELVEEQNVRLDIARKDAITASNVKSQFLANMSHEIRTPLNAILGFSKELNSDDLPDEKKEQVKIINAAADNLLIIVNDVLDFSKIEAGKLKINNHPFSPNQIIEDLISVMAKSAHLKKLEFVYDLQPLPEKLIGDSYRIKQILNNLLSNALKFTDKGHIGLSVSGVLLDHGLYELVLKIEDTGIGISREDRRKLFAAFSQVDDALSRSYQGTGLGLVICQELIKLMRGELTLQSSPGQGSIFTVTIRTNLFNANIYLSPDSEWKDKKIIFFDPYPNSRRCGVQLLKHLGANVTGVESFAYLGQLDAEYDVIFTSIPSNKEKEIAMTLDAARRIKAKQHVILYSCAESLVSRADLSNKFGHKLRLPLTLSKLRELLHSPIKVPKNQVQQRLIDLPPARVLAVDDMEMNLRLLSTWLKPSTLQLTLAYSGKDAVSLCKKHEFDLILMDVQMPHMDGLQATQLIRQTELNLGTPIIAVTAHAFKEEQERLLATGMDDYLPKPLDLSDLVDLIKRWCHQGERVQIPLPSFDWQLALQRANQNDEAAKDLLAQFIQQLPDLSAAISHSCKQKDFPLLQEKIHQLHGVCCYTGVPNLRALCDEIEGALKHKQFAHAEIRVPRLLAEVTEVLKEVAKVSAELI